MFNFLHKRCTLLATVVPVRYYRLASFLDSSLSSFEGRVRLYMKTTCTSRSNAGSTHFSICTSQSRTLERAHKVLAVHVAGITFVAFQNYNVVHVWKNVFVVEDHFIQLFYQGTPTVAKKTRTVSCPPSFLAPLPVELKPFRTIYL